MAYLADPLGNHILYIVEETGISNSSLLQNNMLYNEQYHMRITTGSSCREPWSAKYSSGTWFKGTLVTKFKYCIETISCRFKSNSVVNYLNYFEYKTIYLLLLQHIIQKTQRDTNQRVLTNFLSHFCYLAAQYE